MARRRARVAPRGRAWVLHDHHLSTDRMYRRVLSTSYGMVVFSVWLGYNHRDHLPPMNIGADNGGYGWVAMPTGERHALAAQASAAKVEG